MTTPATSFAAPAPVRRTCGRVARVAVVFMTLLTTACSTLPSNVDRAPSAAFTDTDGTALGKVASASRPTGRDAEADVSGIQLVSRGEEAFGSLYTLIAHAERSLDLQYYIVKDDPYARTLLRAAREAKPAV